MRESRKCQREQELKHVGKELVGVVSVRFKGVAEMIRDAELTGGIECPLTPTSRKPSLQQTLKETPEPTFDNYVKEMAQSTNMSHNSKS